MKKILFQGAGVALITPMNPDFSINWDKLGELVDYQIEHHTDAIIACGTTAESAAMTEQEHMETVRFIYERTKGRVPVIASAGSNDTAAAVRMAKEAKEIGADGLLVVTPYYNKTSQRGLVAHYNKIADATDLPIVLYNVPGRTGLNILPATYKELSKHPNIVAVKEASGNVAQAAEIKHLCGDELQIYSGEDNVIVPILSVGGIGVISVLSHVVPEVVHNICALYLEGKTKESRDLFLEYLDLANGLFIDVNPIPVKAAMNLMGFDVGSCRLPLCDTTDANIEALKKMLKGHGLIA